MSLQENYAPEPLTAEERLAKKQNRPRLEAATGILLFLSGLFLSVVGLVKQDPGDIAFGTFMMMAKVL